MHLDLDRVHFSLHMTNSLGSLLEAVDLMTCPSQSSGNRLRLTTLDIGKKTIKVLKIADRIIESVSGIVLERRKNKRYITTLHTILQWCCRYQ